MSDLFSRSINSISYDDILEFCEGKREEDIDLDYKADWPKYLAQLLCAFANTQGGIAIIGITEDGKSRQPKCPPTGVIGNEHELRQKAINIAYDGVFPPIEPEVAVCPIPESEALCVVVIRVQPSRHMHATDRRQKIYIRSSDSKRGYSLATLSEMRWLFDRRADSLQLRESLYEIAEDRSDSSAIEFEDGESFDSWAVAPYLEFSILPEFPSPPPLLTPPELLTIVSSLEEVRSEWPNVHRRVPWRSGQWRSVPGGVSLRSRGSVPLVQYVEIGEYGHLYFRYSIETEPATSLHSHAPDSKETIRAYAVLAFLDISLRYSDKVLEALDMRRPILISASLERTQDIRLHYNFNLTNYLHRKWISDPCPDLWINLLESESFLGLRSEYHDELMLTACKRLLWGFGVPWTQNQVIESLELLKGKKN